MKKYIFLFCFFIMMLGARAQGWQLFPWQKGVIEYRQKSNHMEDRTQSVLVDSTLSRIPAHRWQVAYGAYYALHPVSFISASPVSDYRAPKKDKRIFEKRTPQQLYEENQRDLEKIRRGEYTTADTFWGIVEDVLEGLLTK